jgi:superfamily II DNA or RNA helicase
MIKLRQYQDDAISKIILKKNAGITKQLVVLPTGAGKTIVFCELIKRYFNDKNVLIIAHRDELIQQAKDKYEFVAGDASNIGIFTGQQKDFDKQITIASVQTMKNYLKPEHFKPDHFDLIICDEAHHATAATYMNIFKYFSDTLLLGFTATPTRCDNRKLNLIFNEIVYQKTIHDMINNKPAYLCRPIGMAVNTNIDISDIKTRMGDFSQEQLEQYLDNYKRNQAIIDTYKRLCPDDKSIVFCINKKHSENISTLFNKAGINSAYIDADTPREKRTDILKNFSKGIIKVICNCGVLTEGFDEPSIQSVFLARPTKSESLYIQMLGRGLRLHPDKQYCKVIDIVDNTGKHQLKTMGYVLGRKIKALNIEELKKLKPKYTQEELELEWKEADNFNNAYKNAEIKLKATSIFGNDRKFTWLGSGNYRFIETGQDENKLKVEISCIDTENQLFQILINGEKHLEKPCTFDWAFGIAEDYLNNNVARSDKILIDTSARWRKDTITEKQLMMLNSKLKIPEYRLNLIYKGEASEIIGSIINRTINKKKAKNILLELIEEREQALREIA